MTKEQIKILATLPQAIEALEAFCAEAEQLRALLARAGIVGPSPVPSSTNSPLRTVRPDPQFAPVAPGHAALDTPERAEYKAQLKNGTASEPQNPEELPPHKQRQAAMLAQIRSDPARAAKLQQFAHDGNEQ